VIERHRTLDREAEGFQPRLLGRDGGAGHRDREVRRAAAVNTTITLSVPEPTYLRCLRVLGAWWCLGSSTLQPQVLTPYGGRS